MLGVEMQASKSSRASSCVHCRQVKLKCDRRERYPSPCSRCASTGADCRTDPAFKRFSSRTRVKELEKEIERLQRNQSLEQIVPTRPMLGERQNSYVGSAVPSLSDDNSPNQANGPTWWFQAHDDPLQTPPFQLGEVSLPVYEAVSSFHEFEELYLPHFAILEPITSLREFAQQNELLFWAIIAVVSRGKPNNPQHATLQTAFDQLLGRVCCEAIQSLTDLQALLLTCVYPPRLHGSERDPSWMRLGMAINIARQIGIDKQQDEVLFGARKARYCLSRYSRRILKLTFLKIFEIDIQLSSWLGHTPTLATAHHLRTVNMFLLDLSIPREYAATIEVHLVTAQYLVTERDSIAVSIDTARMSLAALDMVKAKHTPSWTFQAETALLAAKLHVTVVGVLCLSGSDNLSDPTPLHSPPVTSLLQTAEDTARQTITLLSNLSDTQLELLTASSGQHAAADPLPGYPKWYSCIGFLAATVIIYCIDLMENATAAGLPVQMNEARNSLAKAYKLFTKCEGATEHQRAALNLDVAMKSIGRGRVWFRKMVRTRSAASLVYSLIWLGGIARGKQEDPEFSVEAAERLVREGFPSVAGAAGLGDVVESGEAGEGAWWMDLGFCDDLSVDFFDFSPGGYPGGPLGLGPMDSHC
ncbi:hypothetical protein LTR35_010359 [Friedmanniomyces endolithicus]|uniref:Zn(2)-C6 fungal-type domain-containing protein n=1 Tax=Friedmanniomyces endolithicus TaxID=329885 RepID=A0AAN6FXY4_9PEZI|nr:hypothetical protein LTR35_010359 [Friedmanniomyces endolithicus]KAK0294268.1 hypothetical protein LTS00_007243 [Friedmanniomyces endolithicus]KAK0325488.1 hypothetical protein LTR82_003771 [Friedmanniomyces endolithicus]KAK1003270.1 Regulatory protein leu3 [Friedmanniomyces endolithicus]